MVLKGFLNFEFSLHLSCRCFLICKGRGVPWLPASPGEINLVAIDDNVDNVFIHDDGGRAWRRLSVSSWVPSAITTSSTTTTTSHVVIVDSKGELDDADDVNGIDVDLRGVMLDAQITGGIPTGTTLGVNGFASDLSLLNLIPGFSGSTSHWMAPEPVSSGILTVIATIGGMR